MVECAKHPGQKLPPSIVARRGRTGCGACVKARHRSSRPRRAAKYDAEFIPCKHHVERRCNRSRYVRDGARYCSTCMDRYKARTDTDWHKRIRQRVQRANRNLAVKLGTVTAALHIG